MLVIENIYFAHILQFFKLRASVDHDGLLHRGPPVWNGMPDYFVVNEYCHDKIVISRVLTVGGNRVYGENT